MEKYILGNVRTFCRSLDDKSQKGNHAKDWSAAKNMAKWSDWLTFDIMGDLAFGKNFGMLEKDTNHFAVSLINRAAHRHLIVCLHRKAVW